MNDANKRRGWVGVMGSAGLAFLLFANATNTVVHMACGKGSLALGSMVLSAIFLAGSVGFAKLAWEKAKYLSRHRQ